MYSLTAVVFSITRPVPVIKCITSTNNKPNSPTYSESQAPSLLNNIQETFSVGTSPRYNTTFNTNKEVQLHLSHLE